jgi:hypothetical protein
MKNGALVVGKLVVLLAALLVLSGCYLRSSVSLQGAATPVQPVQLGFYKSADGDETTQLLAHGDGYLWQEIGGDGTAIEMTVFGPVVGSYIVQLRDKDHYGFMLLQVRNSRELYIADYDSLSEAMGRLLFEKLNITITTDVRVRELTDNAALNWALFQELIVSKRDDITFAHYATWVGDRVKDGQEGE